MTHTTGRIECYRCGEDCELTIDEMDTYYRDYCAKCQRKYWHMNDSQIRELHDFDLFLRMEEEREK